MRTASSVAYSERVQRRTKAQSAKSCSKQIFPSTIRMTVRTILRTNHAIPLHRFLGPHSRCLCELDSEIVAVLQWRHLGEEAEILDVAVPARHRGKGYARFLLKKFLDLARERGIHELFLEVRESNVAALALYREFRFEPTGRRPNYYRDPAEAALLLRLKLTD